MTPKVSVVLSRTKAAAGWSWLARSSSVLAALWPPFTSTEAGYRMHQVKCGHGAVFVSSGMSVFLLQGSAKIHTLIHNHGPIHLCTWIFVCVYAFSWLHLLFIVTTHRDICAGIQKCALIFLHMHIWRREGERESAKCVQRFHHIHLFALAF